MPRFLLALLIVCLALPAVAVEACAPPPPEPAMGMAMHEHHAPPASDDPEQAPGAAGQHGCIGCVPPLAIPAMTEAAPFLAGPYASEPLALDLVPPVGPTPPPPRHRA